MKNFFQELRRRNVIKAAVSYLIFSWALLQIADIVFPIMSFSQSAIRYMLAFMALCFPGWLVFAYVYEFTSSGFKKRESRDENNTYADRLDRAHVQKKTLRSKVILAVTVLLVIGLSYVGITRYSSILSAQEMTEVKDRSVAVLPFVDMSPGKDQEWFSDGLTEEILNSLAQVNGLKVISRTSSFAFKNKNIRIQSIADSLGVNYVVEGSVRKAGKQVRITVQLIKAVNGMHLWSNTYDRTMDDIFSIQTDISENIAHALSILLDEKSRENLFSSGTRNVDAYEAFLKGRALFELAFLNDLHHLIEANKHFDKAISLDPKFGNAYVHHSELYAHALLTSKSLQPDKSKEEIFELLNKDLDAAIKFSQFPNDIESKFSKIFFSSDWSGVPLLISNLKEDKPGLKFGFGVGFLILLRPELVHKTYLQNLENDPLNLDYKHMVIASLIKMNLLDSAKNMLKDERIKKVTYFTLQDWQIEIEKGNFQEAMNIAENNFPEKTYLNRLSKLLTGKYSGNKTKLKNQLDSMGMTAIPIYNAIGDYDLADSVARFYDSKFLGSSTLLTSLITSSVNRIYFHLSATPNFSARLKELGIDPEEYEKKYYYQFPRVSLKGTK